MQRRFRLQHRRDFARLRAEGTTHKHATMLLNVAPNGLDHNRYGFITSKRLGKAVQRNRLRRRLREAVRQLHPRLRCGYDVVIVARPPLAGQPYDEVVRIVLQLASRGGLVEET